jgi:hypothetical protein
MKYLILYSILTLVACNDTQVELTGKEGRALPEFNILLSDSVTILNTRNINSDNPFIIFLYSPHCPFSRAQIKEIGNDKHLLSNVTFYAITPFSFTQMLEFNNKYNLNNSPNVISGYDIKNVYGRYIDAKAIPCMAIYGKDKKLKIVLRGMTDVNAIKQILNKLK